MIMLTLAVGPMLGALVLVWLNWKALFFINLPVACLALILGYIFLPKEQGDNKQEFDWAGFFFSRFKHSFITWDTEPNPSNSGLTSTSIWCAFSSKCAAFYKIYFVQKNKSMPLIEPALFATKGFRYSLVICVAQTVGLFIGMLLIPLWIQHLLKLSPLWTGFALMSSAVVTSICSQPAGKYLDRYGAAKIMSLGLMITVASFLLLAWAPVQNVWFIVFCMILHGLGMGLSYMPSTTAGLNSLRQQQQHLVTQAAALNNLFRRIFAAVAVVIAALYLQLRQQSLPLNTQAIFTSFHTMQEIFVCCAILILCTLPFAWHFPEQYRIDQLKK